MCNPVTAIQAGIAAVGGLMQYSSHKKQANAVANASAEQRVQINDQASERTDERIQEARSLRASLRAATAEAGVSGNSIALLGDDAIAQAGRDAALIEKNRRNAIKASDNEARARIRGSRAELLGGLTQTVIGGIGGKFLGGKRASSTGGK